MSVTLARPRGPLPNSARELVGRFQDHTPPDLQVYLRTHARRYVWLLRYLTPLLDQGPDRVKVLDVGPSFQTLLLRDLLGDGQVDTLGYHAHPFFIDERSSSHIDFDLNLSASRDRWPRLADYHIVLMAETIEHLHVGPGPVLGCLASGLSAGGRLVVQTPNAVALHKRVWMVAGRPPIPPLPDDRPGEPHLHEYTIKELVAGARRAGLEPVDVSAANYFGAGRAARAYGALGRVLPLGLRDGLTLSFRTGPARG